MFPRAAKHLENAKQLINNQLLSPTFGPREEKSEIKQQTQLSNGRGGVALL